MLSDDTTLYARWFTPVTQDGVTYDKPLDAEIFNTESGALTSGNYVLTDDINIPKDLFFVIGGNYDVKIHLNGHKIECNNSTTAFKINGGELTVTDNEDGTKGSIISNRNAFTMSSPQNSTINLYNVSYRCGSEDYSLIYAGSSASTSINIYSGEFSPLTASSDFTIVRVESHSPTNLMVSGGKCSCTVRKQATENKR